MSLEDSSSDVISSLKSIQPESQDFVNRTDTVELSAVDDVSLTSWHVLKRDAGYYSHSGMYRGGLCKRARGSYHEEIRCTDKHRDYCLLWKTTHSSNDRDPTVCRCDSEGDSPLCESWHCSSDNRECVCRTRSTNGRYCLRWKCLRKGDRYQAGAEEDYECVSGDARGEYCLVWQGNISSSCYVSAALCRCAQAKVNYCTMWKCHTRWHLRCASHPYGWCHVGIALVVGCVFGIYPVFVAGAGVYLCLIDGKKHGERCAGCICAFCILCFMGIPLLVGVAILGGVMGVVFTSVMWIIVFLFPFSIRGYKYLCS